MPEQEALRRVIARRMKQVRVRYWGERSQSELARRLRVAPSQIWRWERGDLEPRVTDLIRFARECNASPKELVADLAEPISDQLTLPMDLEPDAGALVRNLVDLLRVRARQGPKKKGRARRGGAA